MASHPPQYSLEEIDSTITREPYDDSCATREFVELGCSVGIHVSASLVPFTSVACHPCPQHHPRATSCALCGDHSVKFAHQISHPSSSVCFPRSYNTIDDTHVDRDVEYAYRSAKAQVRGKEWTRISKSI